MKSIKLKVGDLVRVNVPRGRHSPADHYLHHQVGLLVSVRSSGAHLVQMGSEEVYFLSRQLEVINENR